jgi:hypothetical protein
LTHNSKNKGIFDIYILGAQDEQTRFENRRR